MLRSRCTVGLELSHSHLVAVEITSSGRKAAVTGVGQVPYSNGTEDNIPNQPPQGLTMALKSLWQQGNLRGRRVAISLGGPQVLYRILTLPSLPKGELEQALYWELEAHFPLSGPEAVFDYRVLETRSVPQSDQRNLLVVAAPRSLIDNYLGALELAGLEATVAEPEPSAMIRGLGLKCAEAALVVAVGKKYSNVAVVGEDGIIFSRVIPGFGELSPANPNIPHHLAGGGDILLMECRRTIEYVQGKVKKFPQRVVFWEHDFSFPDAAIFLEQGLQLPVALGRLNHPQLTWSVPQGTVSDNNIVTALGLALGGVKGYG